MHISKIHIQNYRNYSDFTMNFHKGLNVIIGSNNSGKTGLLYAINLLYSPSSISMDDFNKNGMAAVLFNGVWNASGIDASLADAIQPAIFPGNVAISSAGAGSTANTA